MSLRVGLTGGIASGKSTVANLFCNLKIELIDADLIAREVVLPGSKGLAQVVELFGSDILDENGELDRKSLRNIVFSDPIQIEKLNNCLHPLIREKMFQRSHGAVGPYHILDVPLLVESQWQDNLDRVLVIDCEQDLQIARLQKRDNIDKEKALNIIQQQASREQRLAVADDVIENNGALETLVTQVYQLHQKYLELAHTAMD